ncbi:hypothetical protein FHS44_006881 [Streptosporangium saharense]|uniref:Uncharacterized protein n=1 Tax=Streptosporangium saharense TaxID=1706840 RepID=A0A7W7VR59_9ACTN|nr:hypothetical protein [Streptosporangium saharense]
MSADFRSFPRATWVLYPGSRTCTPRVEAEELVAAVITASGADAGTPPPEAKGLS